MTATDLTIETAVTLQAYNTFGIVAKAYELVRIPDDATLIATLAHPQLRHKPKFILGGGSNVVLTGDVKPLVLVKTGMISWLGR